MSQSQAEQFLRRAVDDGKFGDKTELLALTFSESDGKEQFASKVLFGTLKLKQGNAIKDEDVMVKMQHDDAAIRWSLQTDAQFHNEAIVYGEILPFMDHQNFIEDIFPKVYYVNSTGGDNHSEDAVVLQDLRSFGYKMSPEKIYLDYEHCVVGLRKLGRFHALSYAVKVRGSEQLMHMANKLRDSRYSVHHRDEVNKLLAPSVRRGVEPLLARGEHTAVLTKFLSTVEDPVQLILELLVPEEPMAVLCLGDFCRNNMMYKYDGKPVDVRMFDFGMSRYTSPVIDLSYFFFLNLTPDVRKERWDDLLAVYHDSLSTAIPGVKVPTLEDIKEEMRRKAVYGYIMCSFFVPIMMVDFDFKDLEDFARMDENALGAMGKTRGGENVTEVIVDLVRDLVLHGCIR